MPCFAALRLIGNVSATIRDQYVPEAQQLQRQEAEQLSWVAALRSDLGGPPHCHAALKFRPENRLELQSQEAELLSRAAAVRKDSQRPRRTAVLHRAEV